MGPKAIPWTSSYIMTKSHQGESWPLTTRGICTASTSLSGSVHPMSCTKQLLGCPWVSCEVL
eukprot:5904604-Lingulodinium_polyedra.AAC.1